MWAQCENEATDATDKPKFPFWRGTDQQYLTQLAAFAEAVRALDSRIRVVLTSFSSETLDAAVNPGDADNAKAVAHIETMLAAADYDAADLHLYACVESIPSKIAVVTSRLPAGKPWIATENGGPDPRCVTTPGDWASNPQAYEQLEAEQVPQRLGACAEAGGTLCLWFSLYDNLQANDVFSHMGLLDPSVTPAREKPAYAAFRSFVETQEEPRSRRHLHRSR